MQELTAKEQYKIIGRWNLTFVFLMICIMLYVLYNEKYLVYVIEWFLLYYFINVNPEIKKNYKYYKIYGNIKLQTTDEHIKETR
ncbi:MAG: hypothetical protein WC755_07045 [Candidatus Woesearchaeota archaeon]|jgi:hypothetical protein